MEILRDKVDGVGYPVGDEHYPDESKQVLKYIFSNSEVSVPIDESNDKEANKSQITLQSYRNFHCTNKGVSK